MRNATRVKYNAHVASMARTYSVTNTAEGFDVLPPMAIRLNDAIQDSIDFLKAVSMIPVVDMEGEAVRIQMQNTLAGRTKTASPNNPREPSMALDPDGPRYKCAQTNFDVGIAYNTLDTWARFPDFSQRYMNAVFRRIGLDRMLIGFYGQFAAENTDRVKYPELQDVNKGWIQFLKETRPEHYLTEAKQGSGKIQIGPTGDYRNLDQLVYDVYQMIPIKDRTGQEVVVIGQGLVANDMGKALGTWGERPTEKNMIQVLQKSYGTLPSMVVANYPTNGFMVTDLRNLQINYQDTSVRRRTQDEPKFDRVVDYISMNEAYMISDLDGISAIEADNVEFVN